MTGVAPGTDDHSAGMAKYVRYHNECRPHQGLGQVI